MTCEDLMSIQNNKLQGVIDSNNQLKTLLELLLKEFKKVTLLLGA